MKRVVFYGLAGGVLLVLLKLIEYKHFVQAYPSEIYGGLVAVIFSALGVYFARTATTSPAARSASARPSRSACSSP